MRGLNLVGWLILSVLLAVLIGVVAVLYEIHSDSVQIHSDNQQLRELLVSRESESPPTKEVVTLKAVADKESGSPILSRVATLILPEEGVRTRPYLDSKGNVTAGIGRNLSGNGISIAELKAIAGELDYDLLLQETHIENGRIRIKTLALANRIFVKPLTKADIHLLLLDDLKSTQNDALTVFGAELWGKIGENRKEALLDTIFALGLPHFKEFEKMIGAIKAGNWNEAATELLKSEAADEAPGRFFRNYYRLKNDKALEN